MREKLCIGWAPPDKAAGSPVIGNGPLWPEVDPVITRVTYLDPEPGIRVGDRIIKNGRGVAVPFGRQSIPQGK